MAGLPNPVRCKAKQVPMTRPAEGPGTPQREMVILDRIRLIGLLQKSPALRGFSMGATRLERIECRASRTGPA